MARYAHNDDMLAREKVEEDAPEEPQKGMTFGSLSCMNIMSQYKIAKFLRVSEFSENLGSKILTLK